VRCSSVLFAVVTLSVILSACGGEAPPEAPASAAPALPPPYAQAKYATVALEPDLQALSAGEREALPLLVAALKAMDEAFWKQVFGPRAGFLNSIPDADIRRFTEINYGPWDRLDEDRPFLPVQPKPATSRFYPRDLAPGELEAAGAASADGGASLRDPYTVVRRGEGRALTATPFHEVYSAPVKDAAGLLSRAAKVVGDPALGRYLELRAEALKSDSYASSDEAWLKIDGALGVVIGPLDPSEDHVNRRKLAYTGAVWVGRPEWDSRIDRYRSLMSELAGSLSGERQATGGSSITFEVADLIHVSGSWNAGPKRFVLELPTDESLRKQSGTRRLLLHNVARAKYDSTLVPLAGNLIVTEQRDNVTFDAFFTNDLLQEMVRAERVSEEGQALKRLYGEAAWVVDVVRANAIGAYVAGQLGKSGESGSSLEEHYTTLVASAFRSMRYGSASAQGPASLILLNKLKRDGAIRYDDGSPMYRVDLEAMQRSVRDLAEKLVGAHDPEKAGELNALLRELTNPDPELVEDLDRLAVERVPIDIADPGPPRGPAGASPLEGLPGNASRRPGRRHRGSGRPIRSTRGKLAVLWVRRRARGHHGCRRQAGPPAVARGQRLVTR